MSTNDLKSAEQTAAAGHEECREDCPGCEHCYEDPSDYVGMGWVGKDGQP